MRQTFKLQEFFEGCHDADVCSGMYAKLLEGKKPKEESKPSKQDVAIMTNLRNMSTIETDATETGKNTGGTRDNTRMTVRTIVTPHTKIPKIGTDTKKTNLTGTIEDMPRLPMARTTRADIRLTMWK